MKNRKIGIVILCVVSVFLLISAFFAKQFVLYDFHMTVQDYSFSHFQMEKPPSADTEVWFSFGETGRRLQISLDDSLQDEDVTIYGLATSGESHVSTGLENPIQPDSMGHFIAALPPKEDRTEEQYIYEFARVDMGPNAFNPSPQRFQVPELPFELVFAESR